MTEKPDLTVLPNAELVKRAIRTGGVQYRALDELARRVRKGPSEWTETGFAPYEIELAFLHLSQYANETDGEFACSQDARIRELERRADLNESRVTEFMNCVVAELRKVEIVKPDYQPSAAELAEDARVNATFDEAVDALAKPVSIRYVDRPEPAK